MDFIFFITKDKSNQIYFSFARIIIILFLNLHIINVLLNNALPNIIKNKFMTFYKKKKKNKNFNEAVVHQKLMQKS